VRLALGGVLTVAVVLVGGDPFAWAEEQGLHARVTPRIVKSLDQPPQAVNLFYITHWMSHDTCLLGRIDEDLVTESGIDGRCSGRPMTGDPKSPTLWPSYSGELDGRVVTGYWHAPGDPAFCRREAYDLTRYFVTWVFSESAQAVRAWVGASDYFKLWLNGSVVLSRTSGGAKPWAADDFKATVQLKQGWNLLGLKHSFPQLGPEYDTNYDNLIKAFSLRFCSDDSGTPVSNLVGAFDPSCTEENATATRTVAYLPSIAHLSGVGGSQWRGDITLGNPTHLRWAYRFRYFAEGSNSGAPTADKQVILDPFEVRTYSDTLSGLFGVTIAQKGYAVVLGQLADLLKGKGWCQSKVYNLSGSGTFGSAYPVLDTGTDGFDREAVFVGLRYGQYRCNLAMFPARNQGAEATIKVTLLGRAVGTPVSKIYSSIRAFWQLNNVFADLGKGSITTDDAILHLEILENPTGTPWFAYVTVNDGNPASGFTGTSDPSYLAPGAFGARPLELP